jgi:polysaccharide chain length determinant protein (PEP-CTERM system associated)
MQAWNIVLLGYLSGVWRRRWYVVAVAWLVCMLGWFGVAMIPDRYSVDAKVYIDTDALMEQVLKGQKIDGNSELRVQAVLNALVTDPNLEQLERLVDRKADAMSPGDLETTIKGLKRDISLRSLATRNFYEISYSNSDPEYAQAVTQALVNLLIESDVGDKHKEMERVQNFVNSQITELEGKLRDAERRRAQFKEQNIELLGGDHPVGSIDGARANLAKAQNDLETATVRRDNLRAQLASMPPTLSVDAAAPIVVGAGGLNGWESDRVSLTQRVREQQKVLDELQSRYTDAHPDVIAAAKLLADLKTKLQNLPADAAHGGGGRQQSLSNPVYEQLRVRLADEEGNVSLAQRHVDAAKTDIAHAQLQLENATEIEAKYADLDRDYGIIKKSYEELLESRERARMTAAVDNSNTKLAFQVIEPPRRSERPVAPNRVLFNTAVLVLGVAAGVGLALVMSIHAGAFITGSELSEAFGLPVIGIVTMLQRGDDRLRTTGIVFRFGLACVSLCVCYAGVLVLLKTSLHLKQLLSI